MFNDAIRKMFEKESNNLLMTNAMYCLILDYTVDILHTNDLTYNPEARSFNVLLSVSDDKREYLLSIQKDMNIEAVVVSIKEGTDIVGTCVSGINGGYKTTLGRISNPRIRSIFMNIISTIADITPADIEAKAGELIREPEAPKTAEVVEPVGVQDSFTPATPVEKENAVDAVYHDATSPEPPKPDTGGVRDIRALGPQIDTLLKRSGPIDTARRFTEASDGRIEIKSNNPLDS